MRHEKKPSRRIQAPAVKPRKYGIGQGHDFAGGFGICQKIMLMAARKSDHARPGNSRCSLDIPDT